jgi:hypothetical protein
MTRSAKTMLKLPAATLLVTVMALAQGCGGSSKTSSHAAASTTPGSTSTTAKPQSSAEVARDRALGAAGLLRAADFPSNWVATARAKKSHSDEPHLQQEAAQCLHIPASQLGEHEPQEVESPKFRGPRGESASNSVTVRPSAAAAAKSLSILENPRTPACLAAILGKLLSAELRRHSTKTPGVTVGSPSVERRQFVPIGDQTVAYRITIPIQTAVLKVAAYLDVIAVRAGRADTSFSFEGTLRPVAAGAETQLISAAIGRLQAAGAGGKTSTA